MIKARLAEDFQAARAVFVAAPGTTGAKPLFAQLAFFKRNFTGQFFAVVTAGFDNAVVFLDFVPSLVDFGSQSQKLVFAGDHELSKRVRETVVLRVVEDISLDENLTALLAYYLNILTNLQVLF